LGQHTPQTMIASEANRRSTLRTDNRLLLQIGSCDRPINETRQDSLESMISLSSASVSLSPLYYPFHESLGSSFTTTWRIAVKVEADTDFTVAPDHRYRRV
jgi:hypothetical protein